MQRNKVLWKEIFIYLFIYMKSVSENTAGLDLQFRTVVASFKLRCSVVCVGFIAGNLLSWIRTYSIRLKSFLLVVCRWKNFIYLLRRFNDNMSCFSHIMQDF